MTPPSAPDEAARLAAVRRYDILDTPPEDAFDRITRLAVRLFGVPVVLVSLVDQERQWFKAAYGLDVRETGRDLAFCAYAIEADAVLVVADATQDARFAANPLVTGAPGIRFYAGAPLVTPDGFRIGTLSLIDATPRSLGTAEQALLADLAALVMDELELRRAARGTVAEARAALATSEARSQVIVETANDAIFSVDPARHVTSWNAAAERLFGYTAGEIIGRPAALLVPPERLQEVGENVARLERGEPTPPYDTVRLRQDGTCVDVALTLSPLLDADGRYSGCSAIARDITGPRRAAARLAAYARQAALRAEVSAALATPGTTRDMVQRTAEALVAHLDAAFARIWTVDDEARMLTLQASAGLYTHLDGGHARVPIGAFKIGRIAQSRRPHLTNDVVHDAEISDPAWAVREGMAAFAGYPLLVEGRLVGVLALFARAPLGEDTLEALGTVADLVAQAVERREAEAALRAREAELRDIVGTMADGLVVLDRDGVYAFANAAAERMLGVARERIVGARYDASPWRRRAADGGPFPLAEHPFARIRETGQPLQDLEFGLETASGRRTVIALNAVPRRDADGGFAGIIATFSDITKRTELAEQLRHRAFHDPLTGLANRALFRDRLEHALEAAPRHRATVAVLLLDLDDFKLVNDSLGHAAGDAVLMSLAARLRGHCRPGDTVARLGGDEFAVLLEDLGDPLDVLPRAEGLLAVFADPLPLLGHQLAVSASVGVGVAGHRPADPVAGPRDLIREADAALYQAKAAGKRRVVLFDAAMQARALARLTLEADLRRALAEEEFELHYQPEVDLATGAVVGVEALLRWHHPERGLVGPDEFIPVAEATGLILPLGEWALGQACRQARAWREQPWGAALVMGVNLSARQFDLPDLPARVGRILAQTGLEPAGLRLEVTEGAVMRDLDAAGRTMRALKGLGVELALDDFGTGYSSLGHLRRFPVDVLKLDRSFVAALAEAGKQEAAAIVRAVATLARALSLRVTAEGIETAAQLDQVRRLGCDAGQGYYFARPLPAEALTARLRRGAVPGIPPAAERPGPQT